MLRDNKNQKPIPGPRIPYLVLLKNGETYIYTGESPSQVRGRANSDRGVRVDSVRRMGFTECVWLPHELRYVAKGGE